jgi:DNA repair protein RadA/Sms
VVACGEVGLGGEVRRVPRTDLRVEEAARLGFGRVLLPEGAPEAKKPPHGVSVLGVKDLRSAVSWLRDQGSSPIG